jgi:hypothetical protein
MRSAEERATHSLRKKQSQGTNQYSEFQSKVAMDGNISSPEIPELRHFDYVASPAAEKTWNMESR